MKKAIIYYCNSYSFDDKKFLPLLPIHRLEKYQKFRFEKDRKNCLGVYILLKNHFSNHGKKMPELFIGENGKPYFPQGNIYFSFSHTDTAFACAVCENEIGLDIQSFETPSDRIIKKICTPKEAERILGSDNKDREFTALWTLKESALKKNAGTISDLSEYVFDFHSDDFTKNGERFITLYTDKEVLSLCGNFDEYVFSEVVL